jgi:DNA polymerase iota
MPIAEAKRICPDLVLADGEDLSPFRDVSKRLYALLRSYSWNGKVERLGLDEIFLDITDIISYNVELLNPNALQHSYFCLSRSDPEVGFEFDATSFAGCVHGHDGGLLDGSALRMRLLLASHLARHLRLRIEEEGYTTACGISTSKLLAKLVGDKNKPRNQTTLLALSPEDVVSFMDEHKLRKVPGIGGKITRVLEGFVLGKEPELDIHSMECSTTVGQVRTHPGISPPTLERLLSGPGSEKGLGNKVWLLLHGVDDTEVKAGRDLPTQISIEDTFKGLNDPSDIRRELLAITSSLLRRMHIDLVEDVDSTAEGGKRRWLAQPRTIRLTTRPYTHPSENKPYNWARSSRSCPLPSFVFSSTTTNSCNREEIAERLVSETLLPLFYKLHPRSQRGGHDGGWNIGLLNVCVTNMSGAEGGVAGGRRDIGEMFKRYGEELREFTVYDDDEQQHGIRGGDDDDDDDDGRRGGEGVTGSSAAEQQTDQKSGDEDEDDGDGSNPGWEHDDSQDDDLARCQLCDRLIPRFALLAHERYHNMEDPE